MTILLSFLVFLLAILVLWQQAKQKTIDKELCYIKERLAQAFYTRENAYILVPSENLQIKELAAKINRLLDTFYAQKAEYELSRQAMVQMMTNISHDLRTPLTVLKGYSELLNREAAQKGNIQDMAAKIDEKADALVRTIDAYFTMSKITSGDMKIDLQWTNLSQICHEVILDYYDILEEKKYDVEIDIGSSPEYAYVDVDAFKRILKNLIDNAILHGGSGKYLSLRLKRMPGKISIEVEDHGQGILEKDQEQIFYRTYTTAHKGSGSGLGLTIAKNLALQMEADILLMSEPGRKTVFTLQLKS
ncbi:MAG: HAMP domain-containing histidine kinase [Muribaculaceae bacterium]|nr:HAMP domain-containing histidine kinase [Muribaculaceae bacterium]